MQFIPDCCIRTIIKQEAFNDPIERGGGIDDNDDKVMLRHIGYAKCTCGAEWYLKWFRVKQRNYPPQTDGGMDDCCVRSIAGSNAFAGKRTGREGNSSAHLWCDCGNHWQLGWVLTKEPKYEQT
jgi:hypothetical protein